MPNPVLRPHLNTALIALGKRALQLAADIALEGDNDSKRELTTVRKAIEAEIRRLRKEMNHAL